jgi:hypothetical protein
MLIQLNYLKDVQIPLPNPRNLLLSFYQNDNYQSRITENMITDVSSNSFSKLLLNQNK